MKHEVSVYRALLAAGCDMASHESDLYVRWSPEAFDIVRASGRQWSFFRDCSGERHLWIEVPFAFMPFWEARTHAASAEVKP